MYFLGEFILVPRPIHYFVYPTHTILPRLKQYKTLEQCPTIIAQRKRAKLKAIVWSDILQCTVTGLLLSTKRKKVITTVFTIKFLPH